MFRELLCLCVVIPSKLCVRFSLQVQCNVFEGADGEVALTAGGGLRQLPGLSETYESAALVRKRFVFNDSDSLVYKNTPEIVHIDWNSLRWGFLRVCAVEWSG